MPEKHLRIFHTIPFQNVSMAGASFVESIALAAQSASNGANIGRVYTATSLPSQIWSFNGKSIQQNWNIMVLIFF